MIHPHQLTVHAHPKLTKSRMVIGLSGWMDGGEVSTGTLEYLADLFDARELASIAPDDFYIYNVFYKKCEFGPSISENHSIFTKIFKAFRKRDFSRKFQHFPVFEFWVIFTNLRKSKIENFLENFQISQVSKNSQKSAKIHKHYKIGNPCVNMLKSCMCMCAL